MKELKVQLSRLEREYDLAQNGLKLGWPKLVIAIVGIAGSLLVAFVALMYGKERL